MRILILLPLLPPLSAAARLSAGQTLAPECFLFLQRKLLTTNVGLDDSLRLGGHGRGADDRGPPLRQLQRLPQIRREPSGQLPLARRQMFGKKK